MPPNGTMPAAGAPEGGCGPGTMGLGCMRGRGAGLTVGTVGAGVLLLMGMGWTDPVGVPLVVSVPAANSMERTLGRAMVRINRGVMRRTISVLLCESLVEEKSRPSTGRSPAPGTRFAV